MVHRENTDFYKPSFYFSKSGDGRFLCHTVPQRRSGAVGLDTGSAVRVRGLTPRGGTGGPVFPYLTGHERFKASVLAHGHQ